MLNAVHLRYLCRGIRRQRASIRDSRLSITIPLLKLLKRGLAASLLSSYQKLAYCLSFVVTMFRAIDEVSSFDSCFPVWFSASHSNCTACRTDQSFPKNVCELLLSSLRMFMSIEHVHACAASTILDPRFKNVLSPEMMQLNK